MMTPFSQWGGIRIGPSFWFAYYATFPFAKITVDQESIQISVFYLLFFRRYRFSRAQVRRLGTEYGVLCSGLVVEHTHERHPSFVLFWSLAWSELAAALQQRGFRVCDCW